MNKIKKLLALLLSLTLCLSFLPVTAHADDGDAITILKRAPVDIVFVLDSTGSMRDEIAKVKNNIKNFLEKLYDYNRRISEASDEGIGIDPRIAIIDYKDTTYPGEVTTFHKKADGSYWFVKNELTDDGDLLEATVNSISISGGGSDQAETATEALAMLYKADDEVADVDGFEWRDDAQKFVFLITDANFKEKKDSPNLPNMSTVINELSNRNIRTSVVTNSTFNTDNYYRPLYTKTGGKYYDIGGELKFMEEIIKDFEEELDVTIVNLSLSADGAPDGIGSVKLAHYTDKDGKEQEGSAVYCGDASSSVPVIWDSPVELEINANEGKNGATDPSGNIYVISELVINGKPQALPDDVKSKYRISDIETKFDTNIQVLFTVGETKPEEPKIYTVSFNSNGGSPVPPQNITEGEKASEPDIPEREGYTFNYWYLTDENTPFDFNTPILSDLTLTASWSLCEKEEEKKCVSNNTPPGLPSDWRLLRHVTHENAISSNYCVIARKQKFDVKPHITGAVIYKSDNKKVARVGKKSGIVKGKNSGDAVITGYVRSAGMLIPTGSYTIHVVTPELARKQYLSFNTDGTIDGNEHIVHEILVPTVWTSSDPSVATVSANSGMISVLQSKGKVRINAFYGLGKNAARYKFTLRIRPSGSFG